MLTKTKFIQVDEMMKMFNILATHEHFQVGAFATSAKLSSYLNHENQESLLVPTRQPLQHLDKWDENLSGALIFAR